MPNDGFGMQFKPGKYGTFYSGKYGARLGVGNKVAEAVAKYGPRNLALRAAAAEMEWAKRPFSRNKRKRQRRRNLMDRFSVDDLNRYPHLCKIAQRLFHGASARSKVPATITPRWILEKLKSRVCEVTGLPFSFHKEEDETFVGMFTPSLDQRSPGAGYTIENTQVVVWCYNSAKGTGSHDDVMRMAEALMAQKPWGET